MQRFPYAITDHRNKSVNHSLCTEFSFQMLYTLPIMQLLD